ncbi:MAG: hypothetical protein WBN22_11640 [Verrucomicrobiia bacterium]
MPLTDTTRVLPDGCKFYRGNLRTNAKNRRFLEKQMDDCAITARVRRACAQFLRAGCAFVLRPYLQKLENLEHNVALYFMNYNFCRIYHTLRVTPEKKTVVAD